MIHSIAKQKTIVPADGRSSGLMWGLGSSRDTAGHVNAQTFNTFKMAVNERWQSGNKCAARGGELLA